MGGDVDVSAKDVIYVPYAFLLSYTVHPLFLSCTCQDKMNRLSSLAIMIITGSNECTESELEMQTKPITALKWKQCLGTFGEMSHVCEEGGKWINKETVQEEKFTYREGIGSQND